MRLLFDDVIHVHYGFLAVEPDALTAGYLVEARGGQRNGLCGAGISGCLSMITGLHTGNVPVRVELHDDAPPLADVWEEVVEASVVLTAAPYYLTAFDTGVELGQLGSGDHRARWCASGMDAARDLDTAVGGVPGPDRYVLQLWPAPSSPDVVTRQTSEIARYWHEVAAQTPPPPPPPTEDELAEQRAEQDEDEARERAHHAVLAEAQSWGGRPPTDELRTWGWRAQQLAGQDRGLVDELAALTAPDQRAVATWAAIRACELADLMDRPVIVEALGLVARGEHLPALWSDWSAVWDALFPPQPGATVERVVSISVGPVVRVPLAPAAAAIDAVLGAADPHPGRAAAGAIDGLSHGAADLGEYFAQVHEVLRRLHDARTDDGPARRGR